MRRLYYKIIISSIYVAKNNGFMSSIWRFSSSFYFAFATSIYMLFIFLVFNIYLLNSSLEFLQLNFIKGKYNFVLNMIFYFFIPIMSINYLLIFKEDKYKLLINEYKNNYDKRYFAWYFMISLLLMFICLFLKK